jgi:hypothetical protein
MASFNGLCTRSPVPVQEMYVNVRESGQLLARTAGFAANVLTVMGFGKPDFALAGYLRVACGFRVLIILKTPDSYLQVNPQPLKVAG